MLSIIACISQTNRAIGYQNRLLYHIKCDLTRFRELTTVHAIIMGRKTYESLPHGALPHRRNIVVSHNLKELEGCEVYPSLKEAVEAAEKVVEAVEAAGKPADTAGKPAAVPCPISNEEIFIIGGESIYRQILPEAHKLYLTVVDDTPQQADAFFPEINTEEWELIEKEMRNENDVSFSFLTYLKK